MSLLIVLLLYPDLAELLNFSDPHFRITLALPTTRKVTRPVNTRRVVGTNPKDEPITSGLPVTLELSGRLNDSDAG